MGTGLVYPKAHVKPHTRLLVLLEARQSSESESVPVRAVAGLPCQFLSLGFHTCEQESTGPNSGGTALIVHARGQRESASRG